jgi:uncharacterized phage-associated protein
MKPNDFPKLATLVKPLNTTFTNWKMGTVVRVISETVSQHGKTYAIERLKWRGELPLLNQVVNVPAQCLRFHL